MDLIQRTLRDRRGIVSIEAIISLFSLVLIISITWGVSIFIFNTSMVHSASQLSAQAALTVYDRGMYRGVQGVDHGQSYADSLSVAAAVFGENTCGMMPDQFTGKPPLKYCSSPSSEAFTFSTKCGDAKAVYNSEDVGDMSGFNCYRQYESATLLEIEIKSRGVEIPFSHLFSNQGLDPKKHESSHQVESTAKAVSIAVPGDIE